MRIPIQMIPSKGPWKLALRSCLVEDIFRGAIGPWKGSVEGNRFLLLNQIHGSFPESYKIPGCVISIGKMNL